jgi:hypothetical protein
MSKIDYTINVHNEYENQSFTTGGVTNSGVVSEADLDSAVQAFANALVSGTDSPYPLTLDSIHKTTTTVSDTTL